MFLCGVEIAAELRRDSPYLQEPRRHEGMRQLLLVFTKEKPLLDLLRIDQRL